MKVFSKKEITESCQKIEGHSPAPFPFFIGFGTLAEATKVMKFLEKAIEQPNLNIIDQNPKSKIEAAYREGWNFGKMEPTNNIATGWDNSEAKKSL